MAPPVQLTLNSDVQLDAAFSSPAAASAIIKTGTGTLTINASNAGVSMGSTNGFTILAGKVVASNTAAFGNANQIVTINGGTGTTAGSTLEFATDAAPNSYVLNIGSINNGTVILNRASSGTAGTYSMGTATLGRSVLFNVQKGGNVTDTPTLTLTGITFSAGSSGTTILNPTTANISITGGVSSGTNFAKTLQLAGTSTGNTISGNITNGTNVVTVTKANSGTWTLSGATNSYTGGTNVNAGTLLLSGAGNMPTTGTLLVAAGGNFSLADGTVRTATTTALLSLASGAGLTFDWGSAGTVDKLTSTALATTVAGPVGIAINKIGTPTGTSQTLLSSVLGGLNNATYYLANNTDFTATLGQSANAVTIGTYNNAGVTALNTGNAYWKGGQLSGAGLGAMALSSGSSSNWAIDDAGTLSGGSVPGGSAVNVIFGTAGATGQSTVTTAGADMNLGSITFNDAAAVTIGGSHAITLNSTSGTAASTTAASASVTAGSAISVTQYANVTNTISANLVLGAGQTWNIPNGKTLAVSGVVSGNSSLTKADTGTLTLSGNNTYSGLTTISAGKLNLSGAFANNIGSSSGISLGSGSTLDVTGLTSGLLVMTSGQTITGPASGTGTITGGATTGVNLSGNNTISTTGGTLAINRLNVFDTIGTTNSMTGGLVQVGVSGSSRGLVIGSGGAAASGLAGTFTLSGGTLTSLGGTSSDIISNNDNGTPTSSFIINGGSYVNAGILDTNLSGNSGAVAILTLSSGSATIGTFRPGGSSASSTKGTTIVNLDGGTLQISTLTPLSTGTKIFNFNGGTLKAGAITLAVSGFTSLNVMNGGAIIDTNSFNMSIGDALLASGSGGLTKSGAGTLTLSSTNAYVGGTSVSNGGLTFLNTNAKPSSGTHVFGAGTTLGLGVATSGSFFADTDIDNAFSGTMTGNLSNVTVTATTHVGIDTTAGDFTYGSSVAGSPTKGLVKSGTNKLTLSGANTFTGDTLFGTAIGTSTGVLRLANSSALGTVGKLIINNGNADTGTVELSGGINIANNIDFSGRTTSGIAAIIRNVSGDNELSGVLSGGSNGANYNFHSDLGTLTISNKITTSVTGRTLNLRGVGAINISGTVENTGTGVIGVRALDAGTYTLGGNNNYTGATTINAGSLSINTIKNYSTNSAIGAPTSGDIVMGNLGVTGTLIYTGIGDTTNRTIQIGTNMPTTALVTDTGGAIIQNDGLSGTMTFNATNFNTATNATAGVGANRTLTLQGSNTGANTISGIIQDNLVSGTATGTARVAVAKAGNGTWVLSGSNTYTGGTTVSNGALTFLNTNAKPSSGTHAFAADTTLGLGVATTGSFFTATDIDNAFSGTMTGNLSNVSVTATTNVGIDTTAGDFEYSSSVSGNPSKGLAKFGTNTLTLSGTNTYTGATQINQGKLVVGGTGSITSNATVGAGTVTAIPVATLGGTGTIGGNVTLTAESSSGFKNGGVLAPTAAASGTKLSVTGTTAFGAGSIFQWDMSATDPATDPGNGTANSGSYGQLAGTGTISGSNAVFMIVLGSANAFTDTFWNTDKTWNDVFTGDGATNSLTSIFSSIGGAGITYNSELGRGDVDTRGYFTLNGSSTLTWTAVPEPTSALAGLLLTFGLLRRRRG